MKNKLDKALKEAGIDFKYIDKSGEYKSKLKAYTLGCFNLEEGERVLLKSVITMLKEKFNNKTIVIRAFYLKDNKTLKDDKMEKSKEIYIRCCEK